MGCALLLALVVAPLAEIAVLIQVGGGIGLWPTIALIVLTATVGAALLRAQGLGTLTRARRVAAEGGLPLVELAEGVALFGAGALLLTPGFLTDAVGFLLLVPRLRAALALRLLSVLAERGAVNVGGRGEGVIEGEWTEAPEENPDGSGLPGSGRPNRPDGRP